MKYRIECKSRKHSLALLKCLYALGYKYNSYPILEEAHKYLGHFHWLHVNLCDKFLTRSEYADTQTQVITLDDFILLPQTLIINLGGKYAADINSDGISVGCVKIDWALWDRLVSAVDTIRKK